MIILLSVVGYVVVGALVAAVTAEVNNDGVFEDNPAYFVMGLLWPALIVSVPPALLGRAIVRHSRRPRLPKAKQVLKD